MKTIAISLQKGGTGKTSLAVTLAAELSTYGDTVLIDADPQGNASAWIGTQALKAELAGVLLKKYALDNAVIKTQTQGLSLLPSAGLDGQLKVFVEQMASAEPFCMQDIISELAGFNYKYAVIDLSPSFGTFEREALTASDEVITPIMPDPFCVDGIEIFSANIIDARQKMHTDKPLYSKIVINALDNRIKQHSQIVSDMKDKAKGLKLYLIPVDQVFRRSQTTHQTIQSTGNAKAETLETIKILARDLTEAFK
ncbi:hypothetical protein AGMMS50222_04760 [Endomicrobiia bacterium]|nr:hypothetical protein AGMMS49556_04780 [Endomicrobiia bacterium]GHT74833.1 hypothetical protein AGMMS50222_04680 [Endomicrobiia bacterium]GHT74856.1 hypothetical protein AGMMS50222_04760 [Endomicrobiia bacterium]